MATQRARVARTDPVAVCRIEVKRADGRRETYYSAERVPWHHLRRQLKRWRHLRFMKRERTANG